MSKEKMDNKDEVLTLRLSKAKKDGLKASAIRQNSTLSKLVFNSLDVGKVESIKNDLVKALDTMRFIPGIEMPDFELKDGKDGSSRDLDVLGNLVQFLLEMTQSFDPRNQGVKGAIRKANGDFKPQQLSSEQSIMKKIKRE